MVAVILILVYGALSRLTRSPFGRTLHAIRVSENVPLQSASTFIYTSGPYSLSPGSSPAWRELCLCL